MSLSTRQIIHLRALCHHLKPVITVGNSGLSAAVLAELNTALGFHELLKVRLPAGERAAREQLIERICVETGAERIQSIGRTATFYRRGDKPRIMLPG